MKNSLNRKQDFKPESELFLTFFFIHVPISNFSTFFKYKTSLNLMIHSHLKTFSKKFLNNYNFSLNQV